MSKQYNVCILGATGAVGEAMLSILEQRKFPVRNLYPLASSRSAGSTVDIAQRIEMAVRKMLQQGLRTADIAEAGMQKIGCAAMGDAVVAAL